jgi:hypothetical protein
MEPDTGHLQVVVGTAGESRQFAECIETVIEYETGKNSGEKSYYGIGGKG